MLNFSLVRKSKAQRPKSSFRPPPVPEIPFVPAEILADTSPSSSSSCSHNAESKRRENIKVTESDGQRGDVVWAL